MTILDFLTPILVIVFGLSTQGGSLTIDNQLVIIANDCYTRIAIGSILPSKDVIASVTAVTVAECEDECSRERNACEIFSFGISPKGNASCLLGSRVPEPDELTTNQDYDIYVRQQSSPGCRPDRLYKLGSGKRNPTSVKDKERNKPQGSKNGPTDSGPVGPPDSVRPVDPNAEKTPNHDKNFAHYPSYQVTGGELYFGASPGHANVGFPSYGYPWGAGFEDDNPNGPYTYAIKNQGYYNGGSAPGTGSYGVLVHQEGENYEGGIHHGGDEAHFGYGNRDRDRNFFFQDMGYGTNVNEPSGSVMCKNYRIVKKVSDKQLSLVEVLVDPKTNKIFSKCSDLQWF